MKIDPLSRRRRRAGERADAAALDLTPGTPAAKRRHRAGEMNLAGYEVGSPGWRRRHRAAEGAEMASDVGFDD